jgi:hypothetical protein
MLVIFNIIFGSLFIIYINIVAIYFLFYIIFIVPFQVFFIEAYIKSYIIDEYNEIYLKSKKEIIKISERVIIFNVIFKVILLLLFLKNFEYIANFSKNIDNLLLVENHKKIFLLLLKEIPFCVIFTFLNLYNFRKRLITYFLRKKGIILPEKKEKISTVIAQESKE